MLFRFNIGVEEGTRAGARHEWKDREAAYLEMVIQIQKKQRAWDAAELSYSDGREREWSNVRGRWWCKESLETSMRPRRKP